MVDLNLRLFDLHLLLLWLVSSYPIIHSRFILGLLLLGRPFRLGTFRYGQRLLSERRLLSSSTCQHLIKFRLTLAMARRRIILTQSGALHDRRIF